MRDIFEGWRDEVILENNENIQQARKYLNSIGYKEMSEPKTKDVVFEHPCGYKVIIHTHRNYVRHIAGGHTGMAARHPSFPRIVSIDYIKNDKKFSLGSFKDIEKPNMNINETTLNELSIADRLKYMATTGIKDFGNRAMAAAGSSKAMGKLNLSAGTAKLYKGWREYVGRKEANGNKTIEQNPTLHDLSEYLRVTYNVGLSAEALQRIIGSEDQQEFPDQDGEWRPSPVLDENLYAIVKSAVHDAFKIDTSFRVTQNNLMNRFHVDEITAVLLIKRLQKDGVLGESVQKKHNITREEFEFFRKMFGSSTLFEETDNLFTKKSAEDITFDPRKVFSKIADFLIDKGIMTIDRGDGENTTTVDQKSKKKTVAVDSNVMKTQLEQFNLSPEDIDKIKNMRPKQIKAAIGKSPKALKTVIGLNYALSKSWSNRVDPAKNVTASGNKVDMEKLVKGLEGYLDGDFRPIEKITRHCKGDREEVVAHIEQVIHGNGDLALLFCEIAHAVAQAIVKA